MIKIIGSVIGVIVLLMVVVGLTIEVGEGEDMLGRKKAVVTGVNKKRLIGILGGLLIVMTGIASISKIPVNTVGVRYSDVRGTITEEPYKSGLHFKVPVVDKIANVSTELRSADIDDMQITSADSQEVSIDIELQYRVMPKDAVETFKQFRSTPEEDWISTFVYQRIQRGVQDAASDYTVIEIMGNKRGEFQKRVDETVTEAMTNNHLTVHTVSVDDLQVSEAIKKSIEDNAKAKQDVETARQVKAKNEVENETKVEKANADAEVKEIEAKAEADVNAKLSEGVTPELVEYIKALARQEHGWYKYKNMTPTVVAEEEADE